ncbi:hypothetical protein F511_25817 [Dorcoceras hygrometricum]|uniref:Uncharacterized protein n=1 Tax=Dorcoceras hygrometricum TaxID=472368 RepID=A0A2Z7C1L6_9LAMI|nr:hypothetical protein F511_25817 [Dorcoceras hygrometricum]
MSNEDIRRVSLQDIQLVQNLIERCLQLYMSQAEIVSTLLHQAKIEPGFTELVWQKLESENQEFFKAYNLRLMVKDQILLFNQLLARQVELMNRSCQTGAPSIPLTNGCHIQPTYQAPQPMGFSVKPESMQQAMRMIPNLYTNGATTLQPCMQIGVDMMGHSGRIDVPAKSMLAQNSDSVLMQGMNGGVIKLEPVYTGNSSCMFGADSNLLDHGATIGGGSVPSFVGVESSSNMLNETILDPEMNSLSFLGQIPRNFSFSDLAADFSHSTDILESYSRSPFLGTDANFLDPHFREDQQDIRRLETITEALSYGDFGSE